MSSNPPTEPAPTGTARWRHPAGWSLRTRLVAGMVLLLALVCLVVGLTTELALRRLLLDEVDRQLRGAAQRSESALGGPLFRNGPPAPGPLGRPFGREAVQAPDTLIAKIVGDRVVALRVFGADGQLDRTATAVQSATLTDVPVGGHHTRPVPGLGDYRLVARPTWDGATVVTGLPLGAAQSTLYQLAAVEAAVTLLALLAAGYAGALIVRRNLRPLDRMAATASRVAQLRLDRGEVALAERVPDADTDPRTEVGQVGAALNRMLGHVGSALAARHASETQVRQFVADASHELRTPLAAIRGYAELTRRGRDPVPPDVAHVLRRVESEAQRMTALVEDMLLLARLDAGRPLARQPVDLVPLVVDAVSDAHAAGPGHTWLVDLPQVPVAVVGDPARLHQVLANLLSNARTHTAPGTVVTVGVATTGRDAVLRVVDNGPGIPSALLPHVFERFARGDSSRSRAAGSTGLGLAIVSAVVTAHAGTVQVDSAPTGTEFTVRLPLAAAEGAGVEPAPAAGYPDRRDPMVFTVYEAGRAAGDSAMKP